jgi:hypothetical protein
MQQTSTRQKKEQTAGFSCMSRLFQDVFSHCCLALVSLEVSARALAKQIRPNAFFSLDTKGIMMMWWLCQGCMENTFTPCWESLACSTALAWSPQIGNNWSAGASSGPSSHIKEVFFFTSSNTHITKVKQHLSQSLVFYPGLWVLTFVPL